MSRSSKKQPTVPKDEPPDPDTGASEWVLACGRQVVADTAEMNRYLAEGWPQCCASEMASWIQLDGD